MLASEALVKRMDRAKKARERGQFRLLSRYTVVNSEGWKTIVYEVWSCQTHRRNPRVYLVSHDLSKGLWTCTCPDFQQNGNWTPCKHVLYVQYR